MDDNTMSNSKTFGKEPAFAKSAFYHPEGGIDIPQEGLTKREYFAVKAMQGILASDTNSTLSISVVTEYAVRQADALIKALNNDQQ